MKEKVMAMVMAMIVAAAACVGLIAATPTVASAGTGTASTCLWETTAYPVLYVRSGPGTQYPVKGPPLPYHSLITGNCTPANGHWYFILDPYDTTYHWANGYYLCTSIPNCPRP